MKNRKFIAIIMVVSMMLMGAGYAAWTQQFTVAANVNTGELDIALSTVSGSSVIISTVMVEGEEPVVDPTYASGILAFPEQYLVEATLTDMYPGAIAEFDIVVTNTGTVGIQLDNIGTSPVLVTDPEGLGVYTIAAAILGGGSSDIAVGGTETIHYTVEFVDGANGTSENLTDEVNVSIPVTYKQFNQ